jgi:hypothetical protein
MPGKISEKGLRRTIVRMPVKDLDRVDSIVEIVSKRLGKAVSQATVMRHLMSIGLADLERSQSYGEVGRSIVLRGVKPGSRLRKKVVPPARTTGTKHILTDEDVAELLAD